MCRWILDGFCQINFIPSSDEWDCVRRDSPNHSRSDLLNFCQLEIRGGISQFGKEKTPMSMGFDQIPLAHWHRQLSTVNTKQESPSGSLSTDIVRKREDIIACDINSITFTIFANWIRNADDFSGHSCHVSWNTNTWNSEKSTTSQPTREHLNSHQNMTVLRHRKLRGYVRGIHSPGRRRIT